MRAISDKDNYAEILRDTFKDMVRSLGMLEGKRAFCNNCTYAQCHIIVEVAKEKSISVNELANRLRIDKSAVSRTVDDLVRKQYLVREQDPEDRRYVRIELTGQGQQLFKDIEANSRRYFENILAEIPAEKLETALEGMRLISRALAKVLQNYTI